MGQGTMLHARRWSAVLATVGLIAATAVVGAAAVPAGGAASAMTISPGSGPRGTTITASLAVSCGATLGNSTLTLRLTHLGAGQGGTVVTTPVGQGGRIKKGYLTVPETAPTGTYAVDATCAIPFLAPIVYERQLFDVTGGPALPVLTVNPGSGPVGSVVDVSGSCQARSFRTATFAVAMFNRSDPRADHIIYASGYGAGPVLHAQFRIPAYFAIGDATTTATCFDYYTNERPFAESTFRVLGNVGISVGDSSVVEGRAGTRLLRFPLTVSESTNEDVFVSYVTLNGDATAGSDYDTRLGVAKVPAGATAATISVPVRGDTTVESKETLGLLLADPHGGHLDRAMGVGRIIDDDPTSGLRVSIGDAALVEGKRGTRSLRIPVTLSEAAGSAVSVKYATASGTAHSGLDFNAVSGTLTIAAGETSAVVTVPIRVDQIAEFTESFTVKLSSPTGATIGRTTGVGKILDDDQP
jgi:Calx-beta domain